MTNQSVKEFRSVSPAKRVMLAGLGYMLIYISPSWVSGGMLTSLLAVLVYIVVTLLLLQAALPIASAQSAINKEHPINIGKSPLLRRRSRLIGN
jgi:L-lactate permease